MSLEPDRLCWPSTESALHPGKNQPVPCSYWKDPAPYGFLSTAQTEPGRRMTFQRASPKLASVGGVVTAEPLPVMTSQRLIFRPVNRLVFIRSPGIPEGVANFPSPSLAGRQVLSSARECTLIAIHSQPSTRVLGSTHNVLRTQTPLASISRHPLPDRNLASAHSRGVKGRLVPSGR
jgi:hypothetical protein